MKHTLCCQTEDLVCYSYFVFVLAYAGLYFSQKTREEKVLHRIWVHHSEQVDVELSTRIPFHFLTGL